MVLKPENLVMMMNLRMMHVTLLGVLGGLGGCLQPLPGGDDSSDPSSSSPSTTASSEASGDTSTTASTTPTADTDAGTTAPPGECGDGDLDRDEACDDGPMNGDDQPCTSACQPNVCGDGKLWVGVEDCDDGPMNGDDQACTSVCQPNVCGDGKLWVGVEVCDDGVNDGTYSSCSADCSLRARHCGDGVQDPEEECDSDDPACLGTCLFATSCLRVHEAEPRQPSGPRTLYPFGSTQPGLVVFCDMESDGGGYTFLKIDVDSEVNDLPYPASKAEQACAEYGMHLLIPRSPAHLAAAHAVATQENIAPKGGGTKAFAADYLQILGIHPLKAGLSCPGKPLTSLFCPQWRARDGGPWYVSQTSLSPTEPAPAGACADCSMVYTWNPDSSVKSYKALAAPGGTSLRFMCDLGDKRP